MKTNKSKEVVTEMTLEAVSSLLGSKVQIVTDVTEHEKTEKAYERRMRGECHSGGIGG